MRNRIICFGFTLILAILIGVFLSRRTNLISIKPMAQPGSGDAPSAGSPASTISVEDSKAMKIIDAIYGANILIYGRVQDESGKLVGGATIEYSLNDKFFKDGTKGETQSNNEGMFRIEGIGASVYLRARKDGYYVIQGKSEWVVRAGQFNSSSSPVVLILQKAGIPQSLMKNNVLTQAVPINGEPREVHLSKGKLVPKGEGHLRVEVWVNADKPTQWQGFDWRAKISVPGGGLAERKGPFEFEAPTEGYAPYVEIVMPATPPIGVRWSNHYEKELFLKLADGTFARGRVYLSAAGDKSRISFYSWWNPSGSRNLEAGTNQFGGAN